METDSKKLLTPGECQIVRSKPVHQDENGRKYQEIYYQAEWVRLLPSVLGIGVLNVASSLGVYVMGAADQPPLHLPVVGGLVFLAAAWNMADGLKATHDFLYTPQVSEVGATLEGEKKK